jgi:hypothetical protein
MGYRKEDAEATTSRKVGINLNSVLEARSALADLFPASFGKPEGGHLVPKKGNPPIRVAGKNF